MCGSRHASMNVNMNMCTKRGQSGYQITWSWSEMNFWTPCWGARNRIYSLWKNIENFKAGINCSS